MYIRMLTPLVQPHHRLDTHHYDISIVASSRTGRCRANAAFQLYSEVGNFRVPRWKCQTGRRLKSEFQFWEVPQQPRRLSSRVWCDVARSSDFRGKRNAAGKSELSLEWRHSRVARVPVCVSSVFWAGVGELHPSFRVGILVGTGSSWDSPLKLPTRNSESPTFEYNRNAPLVVAVG